MFDHQPNKIMLYEKFRKRKWEKDESFSDYMHEKVILGNRVPVVEKELLRYIIDGIPDRMMRNGARISGVTTKEELRARFEQVERWDKREEAKSGEEKYQSRSRNRDGKGRKSKPKKHRDSEGRRSEQFFLCFNCGLPDHISRDCPTKTQGPKCFNCGERGHLASRCVQ